MRYARFYRALYWDRDEGRVISWHRKVKDAWLAVKEGEAQQEELTGPGGVAEIQIPLSTDGIVEWLNVNFVRDNG